MNVLKTAASFMGLSTEVTDESHVLMEGKFIDHVATYGLSFGTEEEYTYRLSLFAKMDEYIEKTNSEQSSYWLGHNRFSPLSEHEYKKMLGKKPAEMNADRVVELDEGSSPDSIDWRT